MDKKKKTLIWLGLIAVAGIGIYLAAKPKNNTSNFVNVGGRLKKVKKYIKEAGSEEWRKSWKIYKKGGYIEAAGDWLADREAQKSSGASRP